MTKKETKTSAKQKPKAETRKVTMPYVRRDGYASHFVDGALVRMDGNTIVLSFYQHDKIAEEGEYEYTMDDQAVQTSVSVKIKDRPVHAETVQIRLEVDVADNVANLIKRRVDQYFDPEEK